MYGHQQEALLLVKSTIELAGDIPPSLGELSKLSGLNEFTLKTGLPLLFGVSPYQYYMKQKMKRTQQLLPETNDTVAMIAYELAIRNLQVFGMSSGRRRR